MTALLLGLLRERVQRLVGALRESDLLKTTILRSVSHDLRTPLTAIIAAGESTGSPSLAADDRQELSSVVVHEAVRLSDLVDNLLDISKLEAGAAAPRQVWCSIEEVIETALERMGERGDRLELTTGEDLPAVWADAAQLDRAFTNLFENASRFAANGAGQVDLAVKTDPHGDFVVVRVSDAGPGIASSEVERIFEPFYRGTIDGGNAHHGPGLGLAIVKGFIEANGGSVRAESEPGQGATFVVELPVGPS